MSATPEQLREAASALEQGQYIDITQTAQLGADILNGVIVVWDTPYLRATLALRLRLEAALAEHSYDKPEGTTSADEGWVKAHFQNDQIAAIVRAALGRKHPTTSITHGRGWAGRAKTNIHLGNTRP